MAKYWSQRPSFTFAPNKVLQPRTIAVLNGGAIVGCRK